jgi:phage replication-related protein YjqB (UPF0714/DUF867 family)
MKASFHPSSIVFFLGALAMALASTPSASAAACSMAPTIGGPGVAEFPVVDTDRIVVQYDDHCVDEIYTKVFQRQAGESSWHTLQIDSGPHTGWRTAEHQGLAPDTKYCYQVVRRHSTESMVSLEACVYTLPDPTLRLDEISNSTSACGPPPSNPSETDQREHLFLSQALATGLGIDPADVQLNGPSPQVRIVIDDPPVNGNTSTAAYTVARICSGTSANRVWVWNADRLFPGQPVTLSDVGLHLEPMAPSQTVTNGSTTLHFTEPNPGSKYLRENVTIVPDKRVALLVPHGGAIELNTSKQIDAFVDELGGGGNPVEVNVWEVVGQWGNNETDDRWHITAGDIHPDGYPGLGQLVSEPLFDPVAGQHFEYAVALHGFGDNSDFGIILGGLADRDLLCHVAATVRSVAGSRGQEIGFHIAEAAPGGGDLLLANNRGYVPSPANVQQLEGLSTDNIVNWVAEDTSGSWGGIQLEQSTCLRKESNCSHGIAACTNDEAVCLHNVVAQGVAQALAEVLDGTTDPAGACCTHFPPCP